MYFTFHLGYEDELCSRQVPRVEAMRLTVNDSVPALLSFQSAEKLGALHVASCRLR
jgi:hypothetical protein